MLSSLWLIELLRGRIDFAATSCGLIFSALVLAAVRLLPVEKNSLLDPRFLGHSFLKTKGGLNEFGWVRAIVMRHVK